MRKKGPQTTGLSAVLCDCPPGQRGEQGDDQNDAAAKDLPPGRNLAEKNQGIYHAVYRFHSGNDTGRLGRNISLGRHIKRMGKGGADKADDCNPQQILCRPAGLDQQQGGKEEHGSGPLLIEADDSGCIAGGEIAVCKRQKCIGEAGHHSPDHADSHLIFHRKLRDRDKHAQQQGCGGAEIPHFEFLTKQQGLQHGQKQRKGRKRNGSDGDRGTLDRLKKGGPVYRQNHTCGSGDSIILLLVEPEGPFGAQSEYQKEQGGAEYPPTGHDDRRSVHKLPEYSGQSK